MFDRLGQAAVNDRFACRDLWRGTALPLQGLLCTPPIFGLADEETGFYYLQSRYYNPELGRFISADVYLSTGQGVLGHNAYAYCLNNPNNRIDPDGELGLFGSTLIGALVGAAISVVTNGIANVINGDDFFVGAAKAAVSGAVSGALTVLTGGVAAAVTSSVVRQIAIDAALGGAISVVSDVVVGNIESVGDAAKSFVSGAIGAGVSSGLGKYAQRIARKNFDALTRAGKKRVLGLEVFKNGNRNVNSNLKIYKNSPEFEKYLTRRTGWVNYLSDFIIGIIGDVTD